MKKRTYIFAVIVILVALVIFIASFKYIYSKIVEREVKHITEQEIRRITEKETGNIAQDE